jgi:hypothetical protein
VSSTSRKLIRIHINDLPEGYAESLPVGPSTRQRILNNKNIVLQ